MPLRSVDIFSWTGSGSLMVRLLKMVSLNSFYVTIFSMANLLRRMYNGSEIASFLSVFSVQMTLSVGIYP